MVKKTTTGRPARWKKPEKLFKPDISFKELVEISGVSPKTLRKLIAPFKILLCGGKRKCLYTPEEANLVLKQINKHLKANK